jgi:hypothetical protein
MERHFVSLGLHHCLAKIPPGNLFWADVFKTIHSKKGKGFMESDRGVSLKDVDSGFANI